MTSFRINGIFITTFFLWASWINPVMLTAQVTPGEDIIRSAAFLLGNAIQPSREGRHHLLLRSLRQLRDPALDPLYQHLLDSESPSLKIHGFLGLLESSPPGKADLSSLAAVKDERLAAEMVNAMMDNELLTLEQARQILSWRDFDPASELLVASYLLEKGQFDQPDMVTELAKLPAPPVRGLAGLLLTQMNHAQGITLLEELRQSGDPRRDILLETLCRAALRQKFDKTAHWGMTIATDPQGVGDHVRDLTVVRQEHVALHEAGAVFNPEWLALVDDAPVAHHNSVRPAVALLQPHQAASGTGCDVESHDSQGQGEKEAPEVHYRRLGW
ncbi:MAG: hypothetical protein HC898_05790 [Phycisphaerales bacterium]|nr:hypothetical protein [Phycisphaerales bacterium]